MLAAAFGGSAGEPMVVAAESPPWIGPLDVLVVAGDDPGDPALVTAAATAVRRGARVVVAAPYEGPLRDATAGRTAVLAPRLPAPTSSGCAVIWPPGWPRWRPSTRVSVDLARLADELDAEALRNSAGRELFTNPAKVLAERISGRRAVLAGDCAATLALARHGAAVFLRLAGEVVAAAGLADAMVALRSGMTSRFSDPVDRLFHDEEFDGPAPSAVRVLALALAAEREVVTARVAGCGDVDVVGAEDVGDTGKPARSPCRRDRPSNNWRCYPFGWRWRRSISTWWG